MNKRAFSRVLSVILCVVMLVGIVPVQVLAADYDTAATDEYYNILSKKDYALCDGAVESEIVLNNDDATRRQVLHVIEVDPNNTNVEVLPSYYQIDKDLTDSSNWTAQVMEKQMDYYRDELGYNVVGGMNTALAYDNEAPYGVMVYNGEVLADGTTHPGAQTYLAVIKNDDGTVKFELRSVSAGLQGDEWQAISANFGFVIKDGQLVTATAERTSAAADRSMIGIKEDGTLVICQAEGRNAPYAVGLSNYEIGEAMLALGCVWAVNGDGGGSSQFLTKREGESDYSLRNIPSDGTPRATINGIVVVSKTAASGVFDHVSMVADNEYVAPGSSVSFTIKGADASGSAAELPSEGITYSATGGTFENGVFTSDGTVGEQTITAYYNGEEAGSATVQVVVPTSLSFDNPDLIIPYNKAVTVGFTALYGDLTVALSPASLDIVVENEAVGSFNGFDFTTATEEIENNSTVVTATMICDSSVTATATFTLGKGSEIVYDFEDQDLHGFYRSTNSNYNYNNPPGETGIVDATTGHVRNGNYAMKVEMDFSTSLEAGYQLATLISGETKIFENAQSIGMWLYVPDEAVGLRIDPKIYQVNSATDATVVSTSGGQAAIAVGSTEKTEVGFVYAMEESGWYYITIDVSTYDYSALVAGRQLFQFYISQKDGQNGYSYGDQSGVNGKYTLYIDDITVDYSPAVEDREAPVFSSMTYATTGMDESITLAKDTTSGYSTAVVSTGELSFTATVSENTAKNNYTGLDMTSGKVYVDGVDYTDKLSWVGSKMSLDVTLTDGRHEIKFSACDKMGNYASIIRDIIVNSADNADIKVVPHDAEADRLLLGSLYYVDVVASAIETVQSVSVTLDLNNFSTWHLDHMETADGFTATYTLTADENIADITITKTGTVTATGEAALVSIPTRTWELAPIVAIYGHAGQVWMYPNYKAGNEILPMNLTVETDAGLVTYTDGTTATFASPKIDVDTEMWGNAYTSSGSAANNYMRDDPSYATWNGGHDHRVETAQYYAEGATNVVTPIALADVAVTCTEDGYTGRTYCETCESVADWGTTIPATGHTYEIVDGVLVCDCGEAVTDSGLVIIGDNTYYAVAGKLVSGWIVDGSDYYYFDPATYAALKDGRYTIDGFQYSFDANGVHTEGQWVHLFYNGEYSTRYKFAGDYISEHFHVIDGKTYWFGENGILAKGTQVIQTADGVNQKYIYVIDENGVVDGILDYTGVYDLNGTLYYVVDGRITGGGIMDINGARYYVEWNGLVGTGKLYVVAERTNGLIDAGWYYFAEDGKMISEDFFTIDGTVYYIVNGQPAKGLGVIEIDGNMYYVNGNGVVETGKIYIPADYTNGLVNAGYIYADETGRIYDGEFVTIDGVSMYIVKGQPEKTSASLVREINGGLYFVEWNGNIATGKVYIAAEYTNGLTEAGWHYTDETGRFYDGEVVTTDDGTFYMISGMPNKTGVSGVREINGELYFVEWNGNIQIGKVYIGADYVNGLTTAGWHYTDETGRLYDGEFATIDGTIYYMVHGQMDRSGVSAVREINGGLYFVEWNGRVLTGKQYIAADYVNGLTTAGWHYTDETGRFYDDELATIDGTIYYMVNGKPDSTGTSKVREIGGELYFVEWNGAVATGKIYVSADYTDGLVNAGWIYTDETGAFYNNEFVEVDGNLYYMVNGAPSKVGVFMYEGDLYFADTWNGKIARNGSAYVSAEASNGLIIVGTHTFDENGKMIG